MQAKLRQEWRPGEPASIIAPIGAGKTYLAVHGLLPLWPYSITMDVKGEDPELDLIKRKVTRYPSKPFVPGGYRLIPSYKNKAEARLILKECFDGIWRDSNTRGGWTVYIDELRLLADNWRRYFGMDEDIEKLWLQGRSRRITVISGTQAPRFVPAAMWEQAKHLFLFRVRGRKTLNLFGDIGQDPEVVQAILPTLEDHSFLYVSPKGEMAISKVDRETGARRR